WVLCSGFVFFCKQKTAYEMLPWEFRRVLFRSCVMRLLGCERIGRRLRGGRGQACICQQVAERHGAKPDAALLEKPAPANQLWGRSEERRVGKECSGGGRTEVMKTTMEATAG